MLTRTLAIKIYFIFPPHLTSASALPGETRRPEIACFHLNTACFLQNNTKHSLKYHMGRAEPLFTVKTIDWVYHTEPRNFRSIASCCLLPSCSMLAKFITVSVAVWKMGVVLRQAWSKKSMNSI